MLKCCPSALQEPGRWARCGMVTKFIKVAVAAIKGGARLAATRDQQARAAAEESLETPSFDSGVFAYRHNAQKRAGAALRPKASSTGWIQGWQDFAFLMKGNKSGTRVELPPVGPDPGFGR